MRKLATYAVLFALAFGIAAGLTAVNADAVIFDCRSHEDQYICTHQTGLQCTNALRPYYYVVCHGVRELEEEPCDCHWIGCCSTPDS